MVVGFDLEIAVVTVEGSIDCFIEGSAIVEIEKNYGADRDGNRGIKVVRVTDIEIDLITWEDENGNYKPIQLNEVQNKQYVYERINDYVLENYHNG